MRGGNGLQAVKDAKAGVHISSKRIEKELNKVEINDPSINF
jgi:hypothetical protein